MTDAPDPQFAPPTRRRVVLDRIDMACLAWAGLFAGVTAALAVVLR